MLAENFFSAQSLSPTIDHFGQILPILHYMYIGQILMNGDD